MNNTAKALLAASTGVALLLGGAGTLAYWSDSKSVPGAGINSGTLGIGVDGDVGCGSWTLQGALGSASYLSSDTLVPGDVLTKTCQFTITATGTNLKATVGLSTPSFSGTDGSFGGKLTADVLSEVDGDEVSYITSDDAGSTLTANVQVTWNSDDLTHQGATTLLDDLTLTATQVSG